MSPMKKANVSNLLMFGFLVFAASARQGKVVSRAIV